ncbi:MAG: hypothetical protein AB7I27_00875 [Bacteriovoracaceae bacterium]
MKFFVLVLALSFATSSFSCTEDGSTGFLPENNHKIPVGASLVGGLSESQFEAVIDKIEHIYAPIVSNMGGTLEISRLWTDSTVNANAIRMGKVWHVNMYGGLARHSTITEDGFSLVLCHEIGHHLGGAPKIAGILPFNKWASNEGQADYYATLKCLRRVFLNDDNAAIVKALNAPAALTTACAKIHKDKVDRDICIRGGMAGNSVAELFAALRNMPPAKFDTPDSNVVSKMDDNHPATQCRLDTYFQGALCDKSLNEDVSQKDEVKGTCNSSLGYTVGNRPLCWFKPKK